MNCPKCGYPLNGTSCEECGFDVKNGEIRCLETDNNALFTSIEEIEEYVQDLDNNQAKEPQKKGNNSPTADQVMMKIAAIGKVSYTDACLGRISAAESAYQILTPRQKEMVTNYSALVSARERYESLAAKNQSAASEVIKRIEAIGPVSYTDACLERINAAESAYQSLTKTQKKLVLNHDELVSARDEYDSLGELKEAESVIRKIEAIGPVSYTDACLKRINAAESAYQSLTKTQKKIVINYNTIKSAQDEYASLKDQSVAERVIKKIKAIGAVSFTGDCLFRIRDAEFAYGNLTGPQKKRVMNHDLLVLARAEYESIRERKIEKPGYFLILGLGLAAQIIILLFITKIISFDWLLGGTLFSSIIRWLLLALVGCGFTIALFSINISSEGIISLVIIFLVGILWLVFMFLLIGFHEELWNYWSEPKGAIVSLEGGLWLMLITDIDLFLSSLNHDFTKLERRLFRVFGFVLFVAFVIVGILGARHLEVYRFTSYGPILKIISKLGLV